MEIASFDRSLIPAAADLFIANYRKQRQATPLLPDLMENPGRVQRKLEILLDAGPAVAVFEKGRLVGYLGSFMVEKFRGTQRKGAYVPEWGHASEFNEQQVREKAAAYRLMYRAVAEQWAAAGCQVHAVTLLAHDQATEKIWYWNGFGLAVVDAIRPMAPIEKSVEGGPRVRPATTADSARLAELDREHCLHYSRAPVFMAPRQADEAAAQAAFLTRPKNGVWLAEDEDRLVGFIRYEGYDFDSVAILESEAGILITGAFVRPGYRARGIALALLQAGLRDYQQRGFKYCAVNFESFNPEAAAFWMKYFDPVGLSVMRVPET